MINAGGEVDLWWLERIVCREMNSEEEDTTGIWAIGLY
jgi:hypothetical protein